MDNSTYKEIVSKISTPLIIGRPVFDEATGKLKDAEAIFANEEFKKYFKDAIEPAFFLSEKIDCLTKEVEWFEAIEKTLKTHQPYEMTFFSPMLSIWLLLKLDVTSTNLIILTFTDVSQYKEYEQTLKRQNLRLAALTEEITVSGEELKRKLQNIEELNRKLEFNAYHDSLTGIFNRTKLSSDLEEILAEAAEKNEKIGVILIDIDNLKLINDSQGHIAGDDIIKQSVQILQSFQKPNLIPYRFDGDEFIIIVREVSSRDYLINLGDAILEHFNLSGIEFSAGVSLYPDDGTDKDELLRYADMAMNDVKKKGKNNVFLFEEIMRDKFMTRLNLQVHLNEAIEKEIFVMYFQPQFNVATGELRGFEALLRWQDSELGWVNPEQFIPIAEETKLIIPLGNWILETSIKILAKWVREYDFKGIMSVNVSPVQLKNPNFIFTLAGLIREYGVNPANLEIEITEGVLIENRDETINLLRQIRAMGIGISLDDFGTGYSSLSYLQILPITTLKIDKSFIANITANDGVEANITDSIISMVTKMGLDTIAEGVEHDDQLELLKKIKCRNIQGFLRGKPMPQDICEAVLAGNDSAILTILDED